MQMMFDPKIILVILLMLATGIGIKTDDAEISKKVTETETEAETATATAEYQSVLRTQEYEAEDFFTDGTETVDIEVNVFVEGRMMQMVRMEAQAEASKVAALSGTGSYFIYSIDGEKSALTSNIANTTVSGLRLMGQEQLDGYFKFTYQGSVERSKLKQDLVNFSITAAGIGKNIATAKENAFSNAVEQIISFNNISIPDEKVTLTGHFIESDKMQCTKEDGEYTITRTFDFYFIEPLAE